MNSLPSMLAALLFITSIQAAEKKQVLSDSEAKTLIEEWWKRFSFSEIPTGKIAISHGLTDERDPSRRRFNQKDLLRFKAWQTTGLVEIREQKNLTKEFTGWDDWLKLTQEGVGSEILILPTEAGKKLNISNNSNVIRISTGSFRITKVSSNEERERDFDRYCLVLGLYEANWTPEFVQISRMTTQASLGQNRKFRTLFKFNKFDNRWQIIASDYADADAEFKANSVQTALDAHK